MARLSHFSNDGSVRMADVSKKRPTARRAKASGFIRMSPQVLRQLAKNPKGNPLEISRIAGIQAAKQTASLIPLCHPLQLSHVSVELRKAEDGIAIQATVATKAATGVEM